MFVVMSGQPSLPNRFRQLGLGPRIRSCGHKPDRSTGFRKAECREGSFEHSSRLDWSQTRLTRVTHET